MSYTILTYTRPHKTHPCKRIYPAESSLVKMSVTFQKINIRSDPFNVKHCLKFSNVFVNISISYSEAEYY